MQVLARGRWVLCLGFLLLLLPFEVARAQLEGPPPPLIAARQAILSGHVKAGLAEAEAHFRQARPEQAAEYWAAGSFLIDYLISLQEYSAAAAILTKMMTDEIWKRDRFFLAQIQSYAAYLAAFGQIDKSALQQLGRVLNGLPARDVFTAVQRRAAVAAAKVDLDSGDVRSAAIWLRRSIVAALSDQNLSGEEVVDLLTFYAKFLSTTRRFTLANKLYLELADLYERLYPRLAPKRLSFLYDFLIFANDSGNYKLANSIFDLLKSDVAQTDLAPAEIRLDLPFQQIFRGLRSDVEADREMAKRDLRERIDPSKINEMASWSRIAHAYLAMLAGDESLVNLLVPDANDAGEGDQIAAYKLTIQAFMRSRSSDLGESFALAKSAAQALGRMFARYELESAGVLPTLTAPERLVLGALTFRLAQGINSEERADIVSLLQQLLVRDKSTLGLQIRLIASAENSDLTKEQVLGFERAKEARDALVSDAIEELIAYVKKGSKGAPRQDFTQLVRLEQLEDYIDRNGRLLEQIGLFRARAYPTISAVQLNLKPEEAVVTHTLTLGGFHHLFVHHIVRVGVQNSPIFNRRSQTDHL